MIRAVAILLLASVQGHAFTVEVVSFGLDGFYRRGRPVSLAFRVTTDAPFRGELVLDGGPVRRAFPLDLPARASRDLEAGFVFFQPAAVAWRAGGASGELDLGAREPGAGEALVGVESEATGRRADRYKMDFPPGSRFVFHAFGPSSAGMFALVDAVLLRDRGAGRQAFLAGLPGSAAFRARGGAVLWVDGPEREWDGRVDPRDDVTWGEDVLGVFVRPGWAESPRPYLPRLFWFAAAPALLAGLAAGLLPLAPRLRGAAVAGILLVGAAAVPLAAPPATASVECYAIEVARGRDWDRFDATAVTAPVAGRIAFPQSGPAEPEPAFFSPRDAGERVVEVARMSDGFEIRPGFMAARSTVCTVRRGARAGAGRLSVTDGRALNETDRDLREAVILDNGSVAWIGELPAGSERAAEGAARLSDLRSRLGRTARRRMFDLWWRRADHDRAYLVAFADEPPSQEAPAAARTGHGVLVVLPLR